MKFVISTQEFNFLVNKCLNVVPAKATAPILSNILIEAVNGEIRMTATDLTVGVNCSTEVKVLEEGSTTLPAKKLAQLVRELTSVNVEVTSNANEITTIVADTSRFKLHGMNKTEFPSLPDMSGAIQFKIKQAELKHVLYRTAFAVSRDDTRYALTGVYMHIANGEASFAGTDGKRLARSILAIDLDRSFTGGYIIPLKAIEEILKNLNEYGEATIYLMPDKIAVEASNTLLVTKLLTGDYPDINRVIPEQSSTTVPLHREELMTLLRQIALFTTDTTHSVRFAFSSGELNLSANTKDVGEGRVSMPVNYHGEQIEIAFNPNFFLDILRHTKEETISIGITDAHNPGVLRDNSSSLFVLMPMRLNEE